MACLVLLAAVGVTAWAYDAAVDVSVRWRVFPFQSLTVIGSGDDPASLLLPLTQGAAAADGYTESPDAIRLHVASNVPWKLQLRLDDSRSAPGLEVRVGDGFRALSSLPLVLASGSHGVYDVSVDLRWPASSLDEASSAQLVATIMPD
jgi:hypothetical protein